MKKVIKYFDDEEKKQSWKLELEFKFFGRGECAVCKIEKDLVLAERLVEENGQELDNQPIDLKCFKHARVFWRTANNGFDELYKPFVVSSENIEDVKEITKKLGEMKRELILPREDVYSHNRKADYFYRKKGIKHHDWDKKIKDIKK